MQRIATILQCNLRAGERPFYVRARIPQESFNLEFSSRAQRQRVDEEQRQRVNEEQYDMHGENVQLRYEYETTRNA